MEIWIMDLQQNKIKKHVGVSNYNQVKRELIKRYPFTKKEFDKEQRKYEGEFGKQQVDSIDYGGIFIDATIFMQ